MQHRVLGRRQEARIVLVRGVPDPDLSGRLLRGVDRRRAGDDAVEIVGESLCRGQGLAAAGRAAVEVREPGPVAVERRDDRLALRGRLVNRAVGEVGQPFGMIHHERAAATFVSGIGRRGGVAVAQIGGQPRRSDRAREAAVAGQDKLAVPAGRRHPQLHLDVRVAARLDRRRDAAERRQVGELIAPSLPRAATAGRPGATRRNRRHVGAGGDQLHGRDRRVRKRQRRQTLAGRGERRPGMKRQNGQENGGHGRA